MNSNVAEPPYADAIPVEPSCLRVQRQENGQFIARWGGSSAHVKAVCCFPWSHPDGFVSLRDDEDLEIAFNPSLDAFEEASRTFVREARFVLEITEIHGLVEEYKIRNWRVETMQGSRTFQTHREEWPTRVENGGFLVRSVAGDLIFIPTPSALDPASRERLRIVLD
jgi:hypothetical protein